MNTEYPEERYPHTSTTEQIIKAAFTVHNRLGHSFQEKVYENALVQELESCNMRVERQKPMRVNYGGKPIGDFVVDLVVEEKIIVELKAVKILEKTFEEKLVHYLKVSGLEIGLLINFGPSVQIKRKIFTSPHHSAKSTISAKSVKSVEISSDDIGKEFIKTARRHLVEEYLPKICSCVNELTEEDIWWRGHETDNSIGNLLLHLNGNMRQWIISGIGGRTYERDRAKEFSERTHIPRKELLSLFEETVREVDETLAGFDVSRLTEVRHFQKWDYSCLYAISHVVEHVAQHMGQIIYITKLRKGVDLKFFNL